VKLATTLKIISPRKDEIEQVAKALEPEFVVAASSGAIFDENTKKYHQFFSVVPRKQDLEVK